MSFCLIIKFFIYIYILAWQICFSYSQAEWKWHLFHADIIKYLSVDFSRPKLLCSRIPFSEALLQCYPLYLPFTDYIWKQCGDSWHVWRSLRVTLDHYVRKHFRSQIPDPVKNSCILCTVLFPQLFLLLWLLRFLQILIQILTRVNV